MFSREGRYSQSCIIGRFGYLYWKLIVVFLFLIHFTMKRLSISTRDPGTLTARPAITDLESKNECFAVIEQQATGHPYHLLKLITEGFIRMRTSLCRVLTVDC